MISPYSMSITVQQALGSTFLDQTQYPLSYVATASGSWMCEAGTVYIDPNAWDGKLLRSTLCAVQFVSSHSLVRFALQQARYIGYTMAKAAVDQLTRSTCAEFGPQGIRCNSVK